MLLEPNPLNHCFGCGAANARGMKLTFEQDDAARRIRGMFRLGGEYQGGPGFVHGGIIATVLDEVMAKVSRFANETAMTAQLTVDYRKPVPLDEDLIVEGWEVEREGRNLKREGEIRDTSGVVLASARGHFKIVDLGRLKTAGSKNGEAENAGR